MGILYKCQKRASDILSYFIETIVTKSFIFDLSPDLVKFMQKILDFFKL